MDNNIWATLLPVVNDKQVMNALQAYVKHRQLALYQLLANTPDTVEIYRLQGAVRELAKLGQLRESVLAEGDKSAKRKA